MTFQIIFAEILSKKIKEEKVFAYTAMRLREIGAEVQKIVRDFLIQMYSFLQKKKSNQRAGEEEEDDEEDEPE